MKILILPKAKKSLLKIPVDIQVKITDKIDALSKDPYPKSAKKLTNQPGYRIRIGDWRVLYLVDNRKQTIFIARIAHRREAYR